MNPLECQRVTNLLEYQVPELKVSVDERNERNFKKGLLPAYMQVMFGRQKKVSHESGFMYQWNLRFKCNANAKREGGGLN